MKKSILFLTLTIWVTSTVAQDRAHEGFYFAFALGPAWGTSNGYDNQGSLAVITGTGAEFDFQMGLSVAKNLIVHGTITAKSVVGPTINGIKAPNNYSLGESMFGVGVLRYTPRNYFIGGSLGIGNFSFSDETTTISTDQGFSFLLKAGKEWWISKRMGLGLAFTYGKTKLTSSDSFYVEKWNSNRFGFLLQATFD